jgi:metal-responsive CopG/Arc/MetJ family transcriptional regulator
MEDEMVRTQIQLTESQAKILHELAVKEGVSISEIIRKSVDTYIQKYEHRQSSILIERAKEAAGKYHAKATDLAKNHDLYLTEDF